MCFTSASVHSYLGKMFSRQCSFSSGWAQYSWTDVSWWAGETTEALQCPHKPRSMSSHQSSQIWKCVCTYTTRMMHMFTLCFLLLLLWVESTQHMARVHYKCDTLWQFDSHTSLLVSDYPPPPPPVTPPPPPPPALPPSSALSGSYFLSG